MWQATPRAKRAERASTHGDAVGGGAMVGGMAVGATAGVEVGKGVGSAACTVTTIAVGAETSGSRPASASGPGIRTRTGPAPQGDDRPAGQRDSDHDQFRARCPSHHSPERTVASLSQNAIDTRPTP